MVGVEWNAIRARLESVRKHIDEGFAPGEEESRKILKQRAQALAREPQAETAAAMVPVLEFILAKEHYAVELRHIREVYPLKDLTPLPCTPPFALGITNLRGQILSVIDLRVFFELPIEGLGDLNKAIVLRSPEMEFGILADDIVGVREVSPAELQPALPTMTGIRREYLEGVVDGRIVVLDAAKLLSDRRLVVHEQVET